MMIRTALAVLVTSLMLPLSAAAAEQADPEAVAAQLEALEAEIEKFKELLKATEGEKSKIEGTLEKNEREINDILKRIRALEKDLKDGEEKVGQLEGRQDELEQLKVTQQGLIARQMVAAYKMGQQEFLKVLLNQEDPNELSRILTYYDYFNEARQREVERYNDTITELESVVAEISAQNIALASQRSELEGEREELVTAKRRQEQTLVQLNREIADAGTELSRREQSREQLETLLRQLERRLARLPAPSEVAPFGSLKGQMLLPVSGRVTDRFGSTRIAGKLKWNGMMIAAEEGTPVEAIHYGHVVFSDWLRGFGLLIIIDHGDGYMSLYGHNQVLYRETGDWVTAGETIATVGASGGQNTPGLYFEIRVGGKPANPQLWCKARQGSRA